MAALAYFLMIVGSSAFFFSVDILYDPCCNKLYMRTAPYYAQFLHHGKSLYRINSCDRTEKNNAGTC